MPLARARSGVKPPLIATYREGAVRAFVKSIFGIDTIDCVYGSPGGGGASLGRASNQKTAAVDGQSLAGHERLAHEV